MSCQQDIRKVPKNYFYDIWKEKCFSGNQVTFFCGTYLMDGYFMKLFVKKRQTKGKSSL